MAEDDVMSKVTLSRPAVGEIVQVAMRQGHVYLLEFDLGETTVAGSEKDVLLTFDDGSGMVLQNFFSAAEAGDFYLTMPDGIMVSGKDMLESLTLSLESFCPSEDHAFADAGHGGSAAPFRGPHLDEVLDTSRPPARSDIPGDLESLLPPSAAQRQSSLPGAHQETENGKAPAENTAAHPSALPPSPADSGDESQDQHLLAHLFLLSL